LSAVSRRPASASAGFELIPCMSRALMIHSDYVPHKDNRGLGRCSWKRPRSVERFGVMVFPRPRRPHVRGRRANVLMDWAETLLYIFWLVFAAVFGVILLIHGSDLAARIPWTP
jgi:hypothetical protein